MKSIDDCGFYVDGRCSLGNDCGRTNCTFVEDVPSNENGMTPIQRECVRLMNENVRLTEENRRLSALRAAPVGTQPKEN